jgi:YfiH family protein
MSPGLIELNWPRHPRVRAASTTRLGGHSQAPFDSLNLGVLVQDDPSAVAANRAALRVALQLPAEPTWLHQVHGAGVVRADVAAPMTRADASWTDSPNAVCVVLAADCLPVLFAADDGSCVAAAHAGWRGLAGGVLEASIAALPVAPVRLSAWLGPCIGPQAFEVGEEVRETFVAQDPAAAACFAPARPGKWMTDLAALARRRLMIAGVNRVYGEGACTVTDAHRFYSFRRDGVCGRMASLVWLSGC